MAFKNVPARPAGESDADEVVDALDAAVGNEQVTNPEADDAGDSPTGGGGQEPTSGQTPEQAMAEYRRKFAKSQKRLQNKQQTIEAQQAEINRLSQIAGGGGTPRTSPVPVTTPGTGSAVGQLTPAQMKAAYNEGYGLEVTQHVVDERIAASEVRGERKAMRQVLQDQAASEAVRLYPALTDQGSELYEAVRNEMTTRVQQLTAAGLETPPDLVLSAAHAVALSGQSEPSSGSPDNDGWDAVSRVRAADRGTPPPASKPVADEGVPDSLPPILRAANARSKVLGANPTERLKALQEHIANDPVSQEALKKLEEGY